MRGVPVYEADCTDFSTNGLGFLLPTECTVEEQANGLYEMTLVQPITDDRRWAQAVNGRILKAVCPLRESPQYEEDIDEAQTVTRSIYKVNLVYLQLQQGPSYLSPVLSTWKKGTEVIYLDESPSGNWYRVTVRDGGQTGYMRSYYLTYDRDITQTIDPEKPVGRDGVRVAISREQLFRIYSVENDTESGLQTVKAMHVFYDLRGSIINETYEPDKAGAAAAAQHIMNALTDETGFTLHCERLTGEVTGKYDYCTPIEAWLDPDDGVLAQCGGVLFRDNYDIYMLPDSMRDMGVTIRRGKNLIGVTVTTDDTDIVTRIIPCGKQANGDPLFLNYAKDSEGQTVSGATVYYIESPRAGNYPRTYTKKIDYDVKVDSRGDFTTEAAARAELERLAYADFDAGADAPTYSLDVNFVLLGQNAGEDLSEWAQLQAVHMFDSVRVIDELIRLESVQRVTGYVWDVLAQQYESLTLGDIQSIHETVYSYNLPTGGISGTKIAQGTVDAGAISSGTIRAEQLPYIIAWGTTTVSGATAATVSLSGKGFTAAPAVIVSYAGGADPDGIAPLTTSDVSATGFKVSMSADSGTGTRSVCWIAIGTRT